MIWQHLIDLIGKNYLVQCRHINMPIGFWERFAGLVTNPTDTIREMDEEPFGSILNYYLGLLGLILLPIILLLIGAVLVMSAVDGASGAVTSTISALIIIVVLVVGIAVAIALMSVCLHIAALICGGNGSFTQTLKAVLNSLTPVPVLYVVALISLVLVLVPLLGILVVYLLVGIVSAWVVALLIVGIQEYHHLTTFRSVAAYFIMQGIITAVIVAIMLILVIIVGVTLGPYMSDPSMYQSLY